VEGTVCTAPVALIIVCSFKCSCNSICTGEGSPIPLPYPTLPFPALSLLPMLFRFISLLFSSLQNSSEPTLDCKIQSESLFENIINLSGPLLYSPLLSSPPFSPALSYRILYHDTQRNHPRLSASKERNLFTLTLHAHLLRCREKP
jgi:hypothetical protein